MGQLSSDLRGDQLAPHSIESEEAVLGSILINPEALLEVIQFLNSESFFIVRHAWIWEAILSLHEKRMPLDMLTVVHVLEQQARLNEVGGAAYVLSLVNKTPSALNVEGYGRIVQDMAWRRRAIEYAQMVARLAHSDETDVSVVYERISEELGRLSGPISHTFTPARVLMSRQIDQLNLRVGGKVTRGISTGLPELDGVFDGDLDVGSYVVIAAPTGLGKTWLLLQIALAALAQGVPVVFFTLETIEEHLSDRLVALQAEVPYTFIKWGKVNNQPMPSEMLTLCQMTAAEIGAMPLEVVDFCKKPDEIRDHLIGASMRFERPGLCFVDTINQLADQVDGKGRYEQLTKASGRLLQIMRETGWGVVAAAQMRNDLKAGMKWRAAKEAAWPVKQSIEGARTIVQHSRSMVGLYSPDYIAKEIHDEGYHDDDCPRGMVALVNIKANESEGRGEGQIAWQSGIPKYGPLDKMNARKEDERRLWTGAKDDDI